jgi:hypothetical protein
MKSLEKETVTLSLPYSQDLLKELLDEFDWEFGAEDQDHPVLVGNCYQQHEERWNGDLREGMYRNAAAACSLCYLSNPAMLVWEDHLGNGKITLTAHQKSSKRARALDLFRRLKAEENPVYEGSAVA